MNITIEFARRDDCLDKMVPSDLRVLVSERDALQAENKALQEGSDYVRREYKKVVEAGQALVDKLEDKCGAFPVWREEHNNLASLLPSHTEDE